MSDRPRQQPGLACEGCRKRKLRCDRVRPKCGACVKSGIQCEVTTERLSRGPKRGSLKALRTFIQSLEEGDTTEDRYIDLTGEHHVEQVMIKAEPEQTPNVNIGLDFSDSPPREGRMTPLKSRGTFLNELMRADLDQLYFDRVHAIAPMLNRQRYFSWAEQPVLSKHRLCLQNAMWTLAMSMSSQFESNRELMYRETRQMLEEQELNEDDMNTVPLEQVQAWILITFYEFLRTSYRRAWFSAGRVFRLVQLLKLHEADQTIINPAFLTGTEDNIIAEEKRRVFWVAYSLDRFTSLHNGLPLTMTEEVVCTFLPAPESGFQAGNPVQGCHLAASLAPGNCNSYSPLADCAILVTLYGRAISHFNLSGVEQTLGNKTEDFWLRHEWIDEILLQRIESLSLNYSMSSIYEDPILLLTHMISQTTTLYLYKAMENLAVHDHVEYRILEYQERAMAAAQEIARIAKNHAHAGFFKAHIFMPVAIFFGAERLTIQSNLHMATSSHADEKESVNAELKNCLEALRRVENVNNLAKYHLNLLRAMDYH